MFLRCLGSSSAGNCYLLDSGKEVLILDCGIDIQKIKKGLNWNISRIVGVCVSHGHIDHSKSVKDFENMGIEVWKPYEQPIKEEQRKKFGEFGVIAFPLLDKKMEHWQHTNTDGTECPCYGFYIYHKDMGKFVYITDTKCVSWDFSKAKLNHILISSNYDNDLLQDNEKREHVLRGHLSVQYVCNEFVKPNKSSSLRNIILCHLSHDNSDVDKMVAEVQKVAGNVNVSVAKAGESPELSLYPF